MTNSKKSLSVKLALAISLLCFLFGCMFLALPNKEKGVYADTTTIADILPGDFPLCEDVLPENTWINGNGIHMMLIQNTLG